MADAYVLDRRRTELTVELSRTSLEAALFAKPPERDARFTQASQVLDEELRRKPNGAWRAPLLVQRGLVDLIWGERLREEAQTLHSGDAALEQARERLRAAAAQLKQAAELVKEGAIEAGRKRGGADAPDVPTPAHWSSLRRQLEYHQARTQRNLGESYAARSPDRLSALEQAVEMLEALSRSEAIDAVTWAARLDEANCRRLLGDLNASERVLDLIDGQLPPSDVADRARAQRIRNRIAAARLDEAQKFFREDDAEPAFHVDPEVRLAELEWLIASAAAAEKEGNAKNVADYRGRATAMASLIEERHSPYFARRAETLLASSVAGTTTGGHDDGALAKAAESFYRQGNIEKALELYDQMFAQAQQKGNSAGAFAAAFTAAALEQQRGKFAAASERFERLAATLPQHARAGEASLLAAFNWGQSLAAVADAAAGQVGLERYVGLLESHLQRHPMDKTASQARLWLAKVYVQRKQYDGAIAQLRQVPAGDALAAQAVEALQQAANLAMRAPRSAKERAAVADSYAEALRTFGAAGAAAKLQLTYCEDRYATCAEQLRTLVQKPGFPEEERDGLVAWLALAEAGAGRLDAATAEVAKLKSPLDSSAMPIVARLDNLAARAPVDQRDAFASLVTRFVELLRSRRETMPEVWIAQVAPAEARALSHLGRVAEARRVWSDLAAARPRDAAVQEGYADFLLAQADRESLQLAAARWREVERAVPEATPAWYRARLGTALAYQKLGDSARARQIADLTAALHPDLGGPSLKPRFDALRSK
ncbi:MAG: hypothetical protein C0483_03600 [Pirellula sp.]|nr:hypothetical protein [Pirellula sp.]